ncbi:sugar phosphate isomerase/epimerase family protein [Calycomorphotria hydatis]|uniref:Xylose isomerase-like TIM barrel domain-containing protein n=1 Tax=Calycomorphotria hydatis TaxID=2528027 RepID=A0A517T7M4_9PLAN|nr:sugar phosphate isomerase/epimerase [Calycomorphotria hydatis]QDT64350.1 hypothetical protein V22_15840 [Calycomorphotria hydatis]
MFVAASLKSFWDLSFKESLDLAEETGFDKVELWLSEDGPLKPGEVAETPESFVSRLREMTRLTPIAIQLEQDVTPEVMAGLGRAAKLLRIAQITVPASPLGTPFNEEVDRLRALVGATASDGIRVSVRNGSETLAEDPHTALSLCEGVKGLGITLDPSYYICGPHRGLNYDMIFKHVYHVHLRDTSATEIQVPVGLGEVDYSRLINKLQRDGREVVLSVSLIPEKTDLSTRPLEMRKLRMLLETLL